MFSKVKNNRWAMLDKLFFSMFVTFSLMELANIGGGIIDGLIVGKFLDQKSLAAVGISNPMYSISGIISGLFASGMQKKCAEELGRGDMKAVNRLFSATFYIGTLAASAFMIAELVFAPQLAILFGALGKGKELAGLSVDYIRGLAPSFPAFVLSSVASSACQLDSGRKRVARSVLVSVVSNVAFDIIAIALNTGVFGIGLATTLSTYMQLGYILLHFRSKESMLKFTKLRTSFREMRELLGYGTEKALRRISNVIAPILLNQIIIFYGGASAMAAMTVQKYVLNFAEFLPVGLADAVSLQVGVLYGERDDEAIHEVGNCVHRYTAVYLGGVMLILLFFARPIASLYISEGGEVLDMTVFGIIMTAFYAPLISFVRTRTTYLQVIGKIKNMQIMLVLYSLIYLVLSASALGILYGAYGVLCARLLCMVLTLLTVWIYYAIKLRKLIPSPTDYLSLPKEFHRSPGDVISLDIRDEQDVSLVAEQIQLFSKGHGVDSKTGMKAALCFEELATNIIGFGFKKCKGEPGIDLRLVYSEDEMVMRLRDNCPMFDVERYIAKEIDASDGELRLGLKMVSSLSDDIKYVHSLETNNVIISFQTTSRS